MEFNSIIERKKVEPQEREKVEELLEKWEAKISDFYHDSLWKDDLAATENEFHVILKEWSSDVLRPVRRVIGSCRKQQNVDNELLEVTAES